MRRRPTYLDQASDFGLHLDTTRWQVGHQLQTLVRPNALSALFWVFVSAWVTAKLLLA